MFTLLSTSMSPMFGCSGPPAKICTVQLKQQVYEYVLRHTNVLKALSAESREGSRAQLYRQRGRSIRQTSSSVSYHTSRNAGTQNTSVQPVATALSNTLSGVGMVGGNVGGKVAIVKPVYACNGGSQCQFLEQSQDTYRPRDLNDTHKI